MGHISLDKGGRPWRKRETVRPSERWREIVLARQRQMDAAYARISRTSADYWARRAGRYQVMRPAATEDDPVLRRVAELAGPDGSVLDVGAGTGRYALPLAQRVRRITAVEPSEAMAERLRAAAAEARVENITIVQQRWEDAQVEPADVVLCAHVLYPIAEVVPFLRKLEEHARRSVVLALMVTWAEPPLLAELWRRFHGDERRGQPEAFDALAVLHELGIPANVLVSRISHTAPMWSFTDLDDAQAVVREHLILAPDADGKLRDYLAAGLVRHNDRLIIPGPERAVACIWWERDGPRRPPL